MAKMSIQQAKRLFEDWRQGRVGGEAAPAKLRRIALAMKAQHGERIARDALGLSSETFWRWGRGQPAKNRGIRPRLRTKLVSKAKLRAATKTPITFVEVTPAVREAAVWRADSALTVSFERADGARMSVVGTFDSLQVERLAGKFLTGVLTS